MRKRHRTPESMVQRDVRTGQHYLLAVVKIEVYRDIPEAVDRDRTRMYIRELDATFGEGLQDLIGRFWVPVPPIQARVQTRRRDEYFGDGYDVHERRIRVVKPILTEISLEAANPVLNVPFAIDWDSREHGWQTYVPEYDDETEEKRPSEAGPRSPDAINAPDARQSGSSSSLQDREGSGSGPAPQLRP